MHMPPGTGPAAYLSFALVTDLIDVLKGNGVLSAAEIDGMFRSVLSKIEKAKSGPSEEAAELLRGWIKN